MSDLAVQEKQAITPLELIQGALSSGTSPEVIRELVALQQSMERFGWEREERQAKIDFDESLRRCQEAVGRIAPNRTRENSIAWADYVQLDRILRPIYTKEGFALSFSEVETLRDGKVMIRATLSRSGIARDFFQSVTTAGNSKMNAADMEASGQSRAQRYLLLKIFNIAVGIDLDERKPFDEIEAEAMDAAIYRRLSETMEAMATKEDLRDAYFKAMESCGVTKDDLDKADWLQRAKYKKEASTFVELKNRLLQGMRK